MGPCGGINDLEIAVAEYIDWFNMRRLQGELGMIPPVEKEIAYYSTRTQPAPAEVANHGL